VPDLDPGYVSDGVEGPGYPADEGVEAEVARAGGLGVGEAREGDEQKESGG
jgi:hypothetical protein